MPAPFFSKIRLVTACEHWHRTGGFGQRATKGKLDAEMRPRPARTDIFVRLVEPGQLSNALFDYLCGPCRDLGMLVARLCQGLLDGLAAGIAWEIRTLHMRRGRRDWLATEPAEAIRTSFKMSMVSSLLNTPCGTQACKSDQQRRKWPD